MQLPSDPTDKTTCHSACARATMSGMPKSNSEAGTPRIQATYVQAMLRCARRLHSSEAPAPAPLPPTTAEARQLHPPPVALSTLPATAPPLRRGFTSMQHILGSMSQERLNVQQDAAGGARLSSRNHCLPWPPSTGSCIHYAPSIFLSSFAFYPNHSSIFISYDHSKSPTYSSISPPKYHTSHELGLDAPL